FATLLSTLCLSPSAPLHNRTSRRGSVSLLRSATSSSLTYSSVLFFMDITTDGDGYKYSISL
ncbi:hypothetical protein LINPERPRIM_LOCUS495, partial [Linum perenne]